MRQTHMGFESPKHPENKLYDLYLKGLKKVLKDSRSIAFAEALSDATRKAMLLPGMVIKVTCKDEEECVFCQVILHDALSNMKILNEEDTKLGQIELTNNSCILIRANNS